MMYHILAVMRVNAEAEALWVRGCQIDDTGPQSFRKWTQFCNLTTTNSNILENQLALQIDKIKAILEFAIVNLKPPSMNAWKRIAGLGLTNGDPTHLGLYVSI